MDLKTTSYISIICYIANMYLEMDFMYTFSSEQAITYAES